MNDKTATNKNLGTEKNKAISKKNVVYFFKKKNNDQNEKYHIWPFLIGRKNWNKLKALHWKNKKKIKE